MKKDDSKEIYALYHELSNAGGIKQKSVPLSPESSLLRYCNNETSNCNHKGDLWVNDNTCYFRECIIYDNENCSGNSKLMPFDELDFLQRQIYKPDNINVLGC